VTRILSDMKKEQGDLNAAADILCELQVETFGSMERREKTEFILEQVALCIEKGDWTQAGILSRKINTRYFTRKPKTDATDFDAKAKEEKLKTQAVDETAPHVEKEKPDDDVTDLKLRYYEQQITLAKHDKKYLDVCKHYRQVLDTEAIENDPQKLRAVLQRVIYYIILSPHNNEQSDLLHRIAQDSRNTQVGTEAKLLKLFTVPELMRWPLIAQRFGPQLCRTDVFAQSSTPTSSLAEKEAHERFEALRQRVIEHNVRVVAKYYTQIRMPRLCQLLDLDEDETERYLSQLVTDKTIYAKIDRPARVVAFAKARSPDEVLNEWSSDMRSLLGLLERIDHLITKEEMMARIQPGAKGKAR
jgi:26S proteasome regulatory subunit N5